MGYDDAVIARNDEIKFDHPAPEIGCLAECLYGVFRKEGAGTAMCLDFKRHVGFGICPEAEVR